MFCTLLCIGPQATKQSYRICLPNYYCQHRA